MQIIKIIQTLKKDKEHTSGFTIDKGILCQKTTEGKRIYLPIKMLKTLIWEFHTTYGHTGADKNHRIIKEHLYHPRLGKNNQTGSEHM